MKKDLIIGILKRTGLCFTLSLCTYLWQNWGDIYFDFTSFLLIVYLCPNAAMLRAKTLKPRFKVQIRWAEKSESRKVEQSTRAAFFFFFFLS